MAETFRLHDGVTDNRRNMHWLRDDLAAQTVEDRIRLHKKWLGEKASEYTLHPDRVRQVVDINGDGKADRATIFSDGYQNIEDGIGAGLLARNGNIYYTCIPNYGFSANSKMATARQKSRNHGRQDTVFAPPFGDMICTG